MRPRTSQLIPLLVQPLSQDIPPQQVLWAIRSVHREGRFGPPPGTPRASTRSVIGSSWSNGPAPIGSIVGDP
jgi:hypothetical protein